MKTIKPFSFSQEIQGVQVKPLSESGMEVKIRYNGLLVNSGASDISMHYGFGESDSWRSVDNANMERSNDGFEASVSMVENQLNFCFRDTASNWDNNNGQNWIYRIS